jgi:hypothetical protein
VNCGSTVHFELALALFKRATQMTEKQDPTSTDFAQAIGYLRECEQNLLKANFRALPESDEVVGPNICEVGVSTMQRQELQDACYNTYCWVASVNPALLQKTAQSCIDRHSNPTLGV